jgi:hypothetical protein
MGSVVWAGARQAFSLASSVAVSRQLLHAVITGMLNRSPTVQYAPHHEKLEEEDHK